MNGELIPRAEVSGRLRNEMYHLMRAQFDGVTPDRFTADLEEKNWVVLLKDENGALRGFSTLDVYASRLDGIPTGVVYSGDTVVDTSAGMGSTLSKVWIGAVNTIRIEVELERLWWLLLTSGYRTYRFLPMYWRDFHPRFDAAYRPEAAAALGRLAEERFGSLFDPADGIVRFPHPQVLRPELSGIPAHRMSDPHVAFFADRNPDHGRGDELACLTELSRSNLTPAGRRMWDAGERLFGRTRPTG